jgi:predicted RND superfamily exporter protein
MPWRDAVGYTKFLDSAEAEAMATLEEVGTPTMTGVLALLARAITAVVTSMVQSYLLAFAIITPLMILLLGSLRMGLLSMIPNLMPIVLTLGLMGIFELPLDAFSLLVGGIAIGLAVDDTIHFMHNYRRYRDQGADLETAVETTLLTAGRAMLITTVVLATGFLGFVLSSMHNLANLGILVSFAVVTAFFADVLLAPALLALFDRNTKEVRLL